MARFDDRVFLGLMEFEDVSAFFLGDFREDFLGLFSVVIASSTGEGEVEGSTGSFWFLFCLTISASQ